MFIVVKHAISTNVVVEELSQRRGSRAVDGFAGDVEEFKMDSITDKETAIH